MRKLKLDELGRDSVEIFKRKKKYPVVVVLDNIRSGWNVGSIFRTADAFALEAVYLCGITAKPPHREILKSAIGASDTVHWTYFEEVLKCVNHLKSLNYTVIGVEQTTQSISLQHMQWLNDDHKYALIFGNEVQGIKEEILPLLDFALEVPQFGTKHSLNVGVCAGIILWDLINTRLNP
jgi:tRNA G18 (ribose-2'-O)-methylase SpoU